MASKMDDFRDLLGNMPDKQVAELADVRPETVSGWRRKLEIPAFGGGEEPAAPAFEIVAGIRSEPEKAGPAERATPSSVRVLRSAIVRTADNRTWRLGFRDVYSGERAAFLWERHRDLVEPFPPPAP